MDSGSREDRRPPNPMMREKNEEYMLTEVPPGLSSEGSQLETTEQKGRVAFSGNYNSLLGWRV